MTDDGATDGARRVGHYRANFQGSRFGEPNSAVGDARLHQQEREIVPAAPNANGRVINNVFVNYIFNYYSNYEGGSTHNQQTINGNYNNQQQINQRGHEKPPALLYDIIILPIILYRELIASIWFFPAMQSSTGSIIVFLIWLICNTWQFVENGRKILHQWKEGHIIYYVLFIPLSLLAENVISFFFPNVDYYVPALVGALALLVYPALVASSQDNKGILYVVIQEIIRLIQMLSWVIELLVDDRCGDSCPFYGLEYLNLLRDNPRYYLRPVHTGLQKGMDKFGTLFYLVAALAALETSRGFCEWLKKCFVVALATFFRYEGLGYLVFYPLLRGEQFFVGLGNNDRQAIDY